MTVLRLERGGRIERLSPGLFRHAKAKKPPRILDPSNRFENLWLEAVFPKEGVWGVPPVTRQIGVLQNRFRDASSVVPGGFSFVTDFAGHRGLRRVTLTIYPEAGEAGKLEVYLGSGGVGLDLMEFYGFVAAWVPGVTGIPLELWELRRAEIHVDVGADLPRQTWQLPNPIALTPLINALVKLYTKEDDLRAETRLHGRAAIETITDRVHEQLLYALETFEEPEERERRRRGIEP